MASISGFGKTGSLAELPAYDLIGQGYAGVVALTGEADRPPIAAGLPIADCTSGLMAFAAIGHALFHRERTGRGQYLDISMIESLFFMHGYALQAPSVDPPGQRQRPNGRHFGIVPPAGTYRGPEGYLVIQVLAPQWDRFCDAVTGFDLRSDARFNTESARKANRAALADVIEAWMQTFPSDAALLECLAAHRVPAAPVIDPADAGDHAFFRERQAVRDMVDPVVGPMRVPGFPIHSTERTVPEHESPAPQFAEHSAAILREVLGYDAAKITALVRAGVIYDHWGPRQ